MAKLELSKICKEIREKWSSVVGIAILHRLGVVEVKESSVIIAVSSPHRAAAIEACAYAINTLKETVPIWKNEQYEGDTRVWKENVEWKGGRKTSCCSTKRVMEPSSITSPSSSSASTPVVLNCCAEKIVLESSEKS
jgi:hypothetical protein